MEAETSSSAFVRYGLKWRRVRQRERKRRSNRNFYISGSATGGLPMLTPTDCVRIVAYDFANNCLRYKGAAIPSSESLTHAAIYESDSSVCAVIHCHDLALWRALSTAHRQLRRRLLTA